MLIKVREKYVMRRLVILLRLALLVSTQHYAEGDLLAGLTKNGISQHPTSIIEYKSKQIFIYYSIPINNTLIRCVKARSYKSNEQPDINRENLTAPGVIYGFAQRSELISESAPRAGGAMRAAAERLCGLVLHCQTPAGSLLSPSSFSIHYPRPLTGSPRQTRRLTLCLNLEQ